MTTWVSDAELVHMREIFELTLPDLGRVESLANSRDGEGNVIRAWTAITWTPSGGTAGTIVPYRFDPLTTNRRLEEVAAAEALGIHYIIVAPWNAPITPGTVTRFVDRDGRIYQFRMLAPSNSYSIVKRCYVGEIR